MDRERNEILVPNAEVGEDPAPGMSPENERVLRERAIRLARLEAAEESVIVGLDLIAFRIGNEEYAVGMGSVLEVLREVTPTPIPCTPDFVRGVVNRNGRIFSVMDLHRFWGCGTSEGGHVILVHAKDVALGVWADDLLDTYSLTESHLSAIPLSLRPSQAACLKGLAAGRYLLDVPALVSHEGLIIHEEVNH